MTDRQSTVLIIEDDRFLRRAAQAGLAQEGFQVFAAAEGHEGLRSAAEIKPDVILLDLLMPGMSGIDVLKALKADELTRGIPVMILSNSSRDQDKQQAEALGAVGYFIKANLSLADLARTIERLLEGGA